MTLHCVQYRLYIDDKEFNDIPNITKGARGNPRVILTDLLNHQLEEALRKSSKPWLCRTASRSCGSLQNQAIFGDVK